MQSNKSSKKTTKLADQTLAPTPESIMASEAKPKSRTLKSSTPKKSETSGSASPKHHHKVSLSPVPEIRPTESKPNATHDDIARLAYSLWAARGYTVGSPEADWFTAEQQLIQQR